MWVGFVGVRFKMGEGKITPPPLPLSKTHYNYARNFKLGA